MSLPGLKIGDYPKTTIDAWRSKFQLSANVADFSAVGDGTTDDTVKIQEALNSGASEIIMTKTHRITDTITVPVGVDFIMKGNAELYYDGTTDKPALVIGSAETTNSYRKYRLNVRSNLQTWGNDNNAGIKVIRTQNSYFEIIKVSRFSVGLYLLGATGIVGYNTFQCGQFSTQKGIVLMGNGTGAVNENLFISPNFTTVGGVTNLNRYAVVIDNITTGLSNNNIFIKPCFQINGITLDEGYDGYPITINAGHSNRFLQCRYENATKTYAMVCNNDSHRNIVTTTYRDYEGNYLVGGNAFSNGRGGNFVKWDSEKFEKPYSWQVGNIRATSSHSAIKGHSLVDKATGTFTKKDTTYFTLGNDYVEISANYAIAVEFDVVNPTMIKMLVDTVTDANVRIGIALWSTSGVKITSTELSRVVTAPVSSMVWTTDFGGIYQGDVLNQRYIELDKGINPTTIGKIVLYIFGDTTAAKIKGYRAVIHADDVSKVLKHGIQHENNIVASEIPTAGTWAVGDTIENDTPVAGGYSGWKCVTAGTPGTWKGYGLIES